MRRVPLVLASLAAIGGALGRAAPARAQAGPACTPKCKELAAMEQELFSQEFLQDTFLKYMRLDVVPNPGTRADPNDPGKQVPETMTEAMQRDAAARLTAYLQSPAGGGRKMVGRPEAGTTRECKLVLYDTRGRTRPFDEKSYRGARRCWEADFVLTHENQHVTDCKAGVKYFDDFQMFAAADARAYAAGIRQLRATIAATAKRCGWKGSTSKSKTNPVDQQDQDVVPTPDDVKAITDALAKAPPAARRSGK